MSRPTRVLFFLPSLLGYPDRAKTILEVGYGVERMVLLVGTGGQSIDIPLAESTVIVDAEFRPGWRPWNVLKANRLAARIIREESINVVHDTLATLWPLFIRREKRFPGVAFCTSIFANEGWRIDRVFGQESKLKLLRSRSTAVMFLNRVFEKAVCARSDRIIVQAPGLIERIHEYNDVPEDRVAFLPNGVDVERWSTLAGAGREAAGNGPVRLLFAGGVGPTRGAHVLLRAMKLMVESGVDATLSMMGRFEFGAEASVRGLVGQLNLEGRVRFPGRVPRDGVLEQFHHHDIFLYQTINDGSPRVVLEAMASGIPIIASHHPGIDVLDPGGSIIGFTEYGDSQRVAELVGEYARNPEAWLERARLGRERAVGEFSIQAVASKYVDFYRSLVGAAGP